MLSFLNKKNILYVGKYNQILVFNVKIIIKKNYIMYKLVQVKY